MPIEVMHYAIGSAYLMIWAVIGHISLRRQPEQENEVIS